MKIEITFDSWEEMELFRTSGKKTRGKNQMTEVEEAVEVQASKAEPAVTQPAIQPVATPPDVQQTLQTSGFPGGNGQMPVTSAAQHLLVNAIIARIDGALNSGQPSDTIVTWFRQQIGPEAKDATIDQIKQVFVPRMSEMQLKQLAPQLGIQA